jgi:acetoin utilization protein AcuC
VQDAFAGDAGVFTISIHEERRWPFTGLMNDTEAGTACNLPVPRGLRDSEFRLLLDEVVVPLIARYEPEVLVLQCGADGLADDPLSRMELTNQAIWGAVTKATALAPRVLVTGGGGYNPWSVARCWSGVWATLNGHEVPDIISGQAEEVLRALTWNRAGGLNPPAHWFTTIADPPSRTAVRSEFALVVGAAYSIYVNNQDKFVCP